MMSELWVLTAHINVVSVSGLVNYTFRIYSGEDQDTAKTTKVYGSWICECGVGRLEGASLLRSRSQVCE